MSERGVEGRCGAGPSRLRCVGARASGEKDASLSSAKGQADKRCAEGAPRECFEVLSAVLIAKTTDAPRRSVWESVGDAHPARGH